MSNYRLTRRRAAAGLIAVFCTLAAGRATAQGVFKVKIVDEKMCCNGCAQKVAGQLYTLPGVTSVKADVANRLVTVTAKPSPKLTLDRLWHAVEQAEGAPSKLVTGRATYVLTRPENLKPEHRLAEGRYSLAIHTMRDNESANQIANRLYSIRGVKRVSLDLRNQTLFIESADGVILSPWVLIAAVQHSRHEPIAVGGPHGLLTIERPTDGGRATAARTPYPQSQGEIR